MKFVFTASEVAQALAMEPTEFEKCRSNLEALDFPRPIAGLSERWSIIDVMNWVNRSHAAPVTTANHAPKDHRKHLN